MRRLKTLAPCLATAALCATASAPAFAQPLGELLASAKPTAELIVFANECVVVRHVALELPKRVRPDAATRPTVFYIRIDPGPGIVNSVLLEPPPRARVARAPVAGPMAVHIEVLKAPPAPPALGEAGTGLPRGAGKDAEWEGGNLMLAVFMPQDFGVGAGRFPSVTTFLSDGVLDVTHRGVRRRMAVRAGDTFWLEAHTRLTVVSDDPIGAAIVQFYPDRRNARAGR